MNKIKDFRISCIPGAIFRFWSAANPDNGEYRVVRNKKSGYVKWMDALGLDSKFHFPIKNTAIFTNGIMKVFKNTGNEDFDNKPELLCIVQKIDDEAIIKSITEQYNKERESLLTYSMQNSKEKEITNDGN